MYDKKEELQCILEKIMDFQIFHARVFTDFNFKPRKTVRIVNVKRLQLSLVFKPILYILLDGICIHTNGCIEMIIIPM